MEKGLALATTALLLVYVWEKRRKILPQKGQTTKAVFQAPEEGKGHGWYWIHDMYIH